MRLDMTDQEMRIINELQAKEAMYKPYSPSKAFFSKYGKAAESYLDVVHTSFVERENMLGMYSEIKKYIDLAANKGVEEYQKAIDNELPKHIATQIAFTAVYHYLDQIVQDDNLKMGIKDDSGIHDLEELGALSSVLFHI